MGVALLPHIKTWTSSLSNTFIFVIYMYFNKDFFLLMKTRNKTTSALKKDLENYQGNVSPTCTDN